MFFYTLKSTAVLQQNNIILISIYQCLVLIFKDLFIKILVILLYYVIIVLVFREVCVFMKKFDEMIAKMHSHYVADDYIQIMLAYRDYLLLFGNNDLMYFKNFIESHPSIREGSKNVYLDDERKNIFPYSKIPEHIERVLLFRKLNFVNQILDFEKPYIRINDGFITKMTAFKDGDEAIVHTKILNGKLCDKRTKTITREELETYLKTGSLEQLDENEYEDTSIFDMNGVLYNSSLELEQNMDL